MKKRILYASGLGGIVFLSWGIIYLNTLLPIITGYHARYLCSAIFVSNRDPADVEAVELDFSLIRYVKGEINYHEKSVVSRFLWGRSKAIYQDGFGSTLVRDPDEVSLKEKKISSLARAGYDQDTIAWPLGNIIPESEAGINKTALDEISDNLFSRNKYKGNAFAFMVVYNGIPITERYRQGFSAKTRFLSWSIAKSFTNALAGIMVGEGRFVIYRGADITAWKTDERNRITINDLMQMQSGLRWNEDYGNRSDVTQMLYDKSDFAGFAIGQPLEFPVGSHWYYSSGSANIVSFLIRDHFRDDSAYYDFSYSRLFNRIGMPDAVFETDPSGTLVGSSYLYATARDYARFGQLYLGDGIFNGERILPEGWVKYTTSPATHSNGNYGSFFWLNQGNYYPSAPDDLFCCNGHDGQRIFIIPSKNLVVVVLGYSPKPDNVMNFDLLLKDIIAALP